LEKQLVALLSTENNVMANAANLSAFVYHNIEQLNWLGFYFQQDNELVLGPFQGQPACTRLPIGQGVCGTAFAQQKTLVVEDVHDFKGHISCDTASESEIVVPFVADKIAGVLDVDSPIKNRFNAIEKQFFQNITTIFVKSVSK